MGVTNAFQPPPRRLFRRAGQGASLLAAALMLLAPSAVAARCASEAEQSVFEVEALKSELMVVGITCKQEDRYNAFMERYKPRLAENYRSGRAFPLANSRTPQTRRASVAALNQ